MIALVVAWMFGAMSFVDGCTNVLVYRGGNLEEHETIAHIESDDQRVEVANAAERLLTTMDAARKRFFPLSIAKMLLGAVMVGFAARAMSGRGGARGALVQIVTVHAGLMILIYFLAADVRAAQAALDFATNKALWLEQVRDPAQEARMAEHRQDVERVLPFLARFYAIKNGAWLVARTFLSGFIVIALTRARSREFFEAASERFSER